MSQQFIANANFESGATPWYVTTRRARWRWLWNELRAAWRQTPRYRPAEKS